MIEELGNYDKMGNITLNDSENANFIGDIVWKSKYSKDKKSYLLNIYVRVWRTDNEVTPEIVSYIGNIKINDTSYEFKFNKIIENKKTVGILENISVPSNTNNIPCTILKDSQMFPKIKLVGDGSIDLNINENEPDVIQKNLFY